MTRPTQDPKSNYYQVAKHCDDCNELHFGNCPKVKVTLTTTPATKPLDEQIRIVLKNYDQFITTKQAISDIKALIANQVREARIGGIKDYADALIDLFVNPPAEVGAAEDIHLHPWQIKNMILESLNHLDELKGDDK